MYTRTVARDSLRLTDTSVVLNNREFCLASGLARYGMSTPFFKIIVSDHLLPSPPRHYGGQVDFSDFHLNQQSSNIVSAETCSLPDRPAFATETWGPPTVEGRTGAGWRDR